MVDVVPGLQLPVIQAIRRDAGRVPPPASRLPLPCPPAQRPRLPSHQVLQVQPGGPGTPEPRPWSEQPG